MPFGHYTSISATGPSGDVLWYTSEGSWSSNTADKYVFQQTMVAVHTAIKNLPAGYRTQVNFEVIEVEPQVHSTRSC